MFVKAIHPYQPSELFPHSLFGGSKMAGTAKKINKGTVAAGIFAALGIIACAAGIAALTGAIVLSSAAAGFFCFLERRLRLPVLLFSGFAGRIILFPELAEYGLIIPKTLFRE